MNDSVPETLTVLPDPKLFRVARWTQRACLGVVAIEILYGLIPLTEMEPGGLGAAGARGNLPALLTALFCGASLLLSEAHRKGVAVSYGLRIANILAVFFAAVVIFWARAASVASNPVHDSAHDPAHIAFPPAMLALGFVLAVVVVVFVESKNWLMGHIVDVLVCGLCLLVLVQVADAAFGRFALFGKAEGGWSEISQAHMALLVCLVALTAVVTLRQAEHGVFSIFLGVGDGSRLARIFAPILLLLPFAWVAANARMSHGGSAGHPGAAVLGSAAAAVAIGILLFFAWRISRMENEIHDLILRDEATRLYNSRGFHLLAEHALRLAQRSGVPFSVLFIDFENLAEIHMELGPNAVAASLAEAGEILRATFRESDIKGRIAGDEFAVAGQFDRAGISVAALRLEAATAARCVKNPGPIPLKLSMGHVTTSAANAQESLKELLTRAGQARNRLDPQLTEMRVN